MTNTSLSLRNHPLLLVGLSLALSIHPASGADFYVATSGDDHSSGTAAEKHGGDGPFATLDRARQAAKKLRAEQPGRTEPIVIQLRGGTYYSTMKQPFSAAESGSTESPLVIEAYPGETPVLSAGREIRGWKKTGGGRWEADVPEARKGEWKFSQFYVNGQRRFRPSLPKTGYYFVASPVAGTKLWSSDRFQFHQGDLKAGWKNLSDIEMVAFHKWSISRLPLKAIDERSRVCDLGGSTWNPGISPIDRGTYYKVENVKEALDIAGEWYLDRQTGTLSYLPMPGETPEGTLAIAPRGTRVLTLAGDPRNGDFVENLIFRGLVFAHTNWNVPEKGYSSFQADKAVDGTITMDYARNIRIENCGFRHTGNYGIKIGVGCREVVVEGCEFVDVGAGGVRVGSDRFNEEPDKSKWTSHCTIRDNLVAHGGRVHPGSVGIWLAHAHDCVVEHNEIHDLYYSGMSIGWRWAEGISPATNNKIAYNLIRDIGHGVLSDMGGIYLLGEAPGTVVHHNRIDNVRRARYGGWGIYLDASSANVLVENNVVTETDDGGFHLHWGSENTAQNNIFAYSARSLLQLSNAKRSGSLQLRKNIFLWKDGDLFQGKLDDEFQFANNLYWQEGGGDFQFPDGNSAQLWREREKDMVVANPLFVDPGKGDFALREDSPATGIGFEAIDLTEVGRLTSGRGWEKVPEVPQAFEAPGAFPPIVMEEDFELQHSGRSLAGWGQIAASPKENVTVFEAAEGFAASGTKCLKFSDGPGGAVFFPHIYREIGYTQGKIVVAFDIRAEEGAHMRFDFRDWDQAKYINGISLEMRPGGEFLASGKELLKAPTNQWIAVRATGGVGPDNKGVYDVEVTLPGASEPQRFSGISYQKGFETITWAGFSCNAKQPANYFIDNLVIRPE